MYYKCNKTLLEFCKAELIQTNPVPFSCHSQYSSFQISINNFTCSMNFP